MFGHRKMAGGQEAVLQCAGLEGKGRRRGCVSGEVSVGLRWIVSRVGEACGRLCFGSWKPWVMTAWFEMGGKSRGEAGGRMRKGRDEEEVGRAWGGKRKKGRKKEERKKE